MNPIYLFVCGFFWSKYGDMRAGWELIAGLQAYDPEIRQLSIAMLARHPAGLSRLIGEALEFGVLLPEDGWRALHGSGNSSLRRTSSPLVEMDVKREKHEFSVWIGSD
jgi:hypothetical protein